MPGESFGSLWDAFGLSCLSLGLPLASFGMPWDPLRLSLASFVAPYSPLWSHSWKSLEIDPPWEGGADVDFSIEIDVSSGMLGLELIRG